MPSQQPPQPQTIRIEVAKGPGDLACAMAIREVAFIEEQQVPPEVERDELDANAYHLLAYAGGHAVGTGRLVVLPEPPEGESGRWGRVGRMAVLDSHRKHGVGRKLLEAFEAEARKRGLDGVVIYSQVYVLGFYEKAGYQVRGPLFEEGGLPHKELRKRLGG
jgi:predicted GNAT family N-acyltransferase